MLRARFVALDSMNLWIDIARDSLIRTIEQVDCLMLNDAELRQDLGTSRTCSRAARAVMASAPRVVVAKQGEYGAALYTRESFFGLPAYPPGDRHRSRPARATRSPAASSATSPRTSDEEIYDELLRRAMAYATALASFNVEEFGTERMQTLGGDEVTERVGALQRATAFDATSVPLRT